MNLVHSGIHAIIDFFSKQARLLSWKKCFVFHTSMFMRVLLVFFFLCECVELRFHIILIFLWLSELYLYTLVMFLLYIYFDDCSSYMRIKNPASLAPVLPFRFSNLRYDVMEKKYWRNLFQCACVRRSGRRIDIGVETAHLRFDYLENLSRITLKTVSF